MYYYANIPKEKHPKLYSFPFKKTPINYVDKVTLNGKDVTMGCFALFSIFGFGYVDCYSVNEYGEKPGIFRLENGEIAREPRRYGRVKVTHS